MQINNIIIGLIILTIILHLCGAFLALSKKDKFSLFVSFIGVGINLIIFIINWVEAGNPPFGNMYHVMIFASMCFMPMYLILKYRNKQDWLLFYFTFTSAVPLIGALCMEKEIGWKRMPALQSIWFVPHVTAYMISYSLATVAFVLSLVYYLKKFGNVNVDYNKYSKAIYNTILLSFPLMTFGMLSGALWAEEAWGVYWSWDVKETWSLITWFLYLLYFHIKRTNLNKWDLCIQILAFLALLITFFVVNFGLIPKLNSMLHSYA